MMVDDRDRHALDEIERHLTRQDPALAARLCGAAVRPFPALSVVCALTYIALPITALLYGGAGASVTGALAAVTVLVILLSRRRRRPQASSPD